jgi:hypothetical protein
MAEVGMSEKIVNMLTEIGQLQCELRTMTIESHDREHAAIAAAKPEGK